MIADVKLSISSELNHNDETMRLGIAKKNKNYKS